MDKLRIIMLLGVLVLCQCGKDEPEPDPVVIVDPITTTTEDGTVTYYLDGVKKTISNPFSITSVVMNGIWIFGAMDTSIADQATMVIINLDSVPNVGTHYFSDTMNTFGLNNYIALSIGQGNGEKALLFYSIWCSDNDNNNAYVDVTKIDFGTSLMSGTFAGKVGGYYPPILDSTEHVITNGVFTNITFLH